MSMRRFFHLSENRNIAMFYLLTASLNMWFVAGVWIFIWGKFMTNQEIGISDAMTFAFALLLELPSGVIADLIGRKRAIVFGHICMVLGTACLAAAGSFWGITLAYALWTFGYAFQSGTTEALAYDSLTKEQQKNDWSRIIGTSVIIRRITSLTCTALGGFLFAVHFRLPYSVMAVLGIIGIIAALALREQKVSHKHNLRELATYTNQIRDGVGVLLHKAIWPVAITALVVMGVDYMYNWGLLRPLTALRFGYDEVTIPLLQSFTSIIVIGSILLLPKLRRRIGTVRFLFMAAVLFGASFASFFLPLSWVIGGLAVIAMAVLGMYVEQLFSVFINARTKSEHRATTLSTVSLIIKIPYVALAIITGILADQNQLAPFSLGVGVFVLAVCLIGLVAYRRLPLAAKSAKAI